MKTLLWSAKTEEYELRSSHDPTAKLCGTKMHNLYYITVRIAICFPALWGAGISPVQCKLTTRFGCNSSARNHARPDWLHLYADSELSSRPFFWATAELPRANVGGLAVTE